MGSTPISSAGGLVMAQKEKPCRRCGGSGEDPDAHHRYTSGGKDDRRCKKCNGDGTIVEEETNESDPAGSGDRLENG